MPVVIVCGWATGIILGGGTEADRGDYLERFDPEFHHGTGAVWWTKDIAKAKRYPDLVSAFEDWRRQSKTRPTRPWDGQPNRPMTAYTVTFENVEE